MRNFTFVLLFFSLVLIVSCGPTVEDAIKYNNDIEKQNELVLGKLEELIDSYDQYVPEEMDNAYSAAVAQVDKSIDFINKLGPLGEDSTFRDGAKKLFATYKSVLEVEHKRIIELLKLPASEYGNDEVAEDARMRELANQKIDVELNKMFKVQESFAKKHQFELVREE